MIRIPLIFLFVLVLTLSLARPGSAQEYTRYVRATEGVLLPSPSLTETNDATALSTNPANIALLDSWNLMYVGSWLNKQQHLTGQGHGFFFSFPLGPLAFGTAVEALTPSESVRAWQGLDDRVRFSLGMALHLNRALALGAAYRTFWYDSYGDVSSWDLSLTVHPANLLALSFIVADINQPNVKYNPNADATTYTRAPNAPRRFGVGLTVRPFSNDRLSLGGELNYISGDVGRTDFTGLLTGMIVDGLTVRGRFGIEGLGDDGRENSYFLDGSLVVDLPNFGLGVSTFGQLAPEGAEGYQGTAWAVRLSGDDAPAIKLPRPLRPIRAALIKLERRPDSLGWAGLMQLLQRISRDPGVDMVVFKLQGGVFSLSQSQEMRRRIRALKEGGRNVVCHLTDGSGAVYAACAGADRIWLNPAGAIMLTGVQTRLLYFRKALDKLGMKADIVRIGKYKASPEMLTRSGPSDPSREQLDRYLDSIFHQFVQGLTDDRRYAGKDEVVKLIDQGPFSARGALARKLVDQLVPEDRLEEELGALVGGGLIVDDEYGRDPLRHRRYLDSPAVAVVHFAGDIVDGESLDLPVLDIHTVGSKTMTEALRQVRSDPRIRAVVLRIDSPGGSALASELIWHEVMALRREKPVIASMGGVAASGGYYIASAADEIFAESTTLTGSIGIFSGKADLSGFLDKIGVDYAQFKRGAHADIQSWTRPYTDEERRLMMHRIEEQYLLFRERVVEGRGNTLTAEKVDELGRGRIWSGEDARSRQLVDQIGGYLDALERARELAHVKQDTPVFHLPRPSMSLSMRLITSLKAVLHEPSPLDALVMTPRLKRTLGAAYPFLLMEPSRPLARLPYVIIEE